MGERWMKSELELSGVIWNGDLEARYVMDWRRYDPVESRTRWKHSLTTMCLGVTTSSFPRKALVTKLALALLCSAPQMKGKIRL